MKDTVFSSFLPGWRTPEFWAIALSQSGILLAATAGVLPPKYAALAVAGSQVAYNVSRALALARHRRAVRSARRSPAPFKIA